jgi:hypothetical protein
MRGRPDSGSFADFLEIRFVGAMALKLSAMGSELTSTTRHGPSLGNAIATEQACRLFSGTSSLF